MAVVGVPIQIPGLVAGEAITESYLLVQAQSGAVNAAYLADGASGVAVIGVCTEVVASGAACPVEFGVTKVRCGGTVTVGERIMAETATARAITWATDTSYCCGIALETGADGDVIRALIMPTLDRTATS